MQHARVLLEHGRELPHGRVDVPAAGLVEVDDRVRHARDRELAPRQDAGQMAPEIRRRIVVRHRLDQFGRPLRRCRDGVVAEPPLFEDDFRLAQSDRRSKRTSAK